jgi:hypothetical protein
VRGLDLNLTASKKLNNRYSYGIRIQ